MSEPVTCIQKQPPTHTPAPWRAISSDLRDGGAVVWAGSANHETIALVLRNDADLALIAKAPDLLAFAERTLPQLIAERDCYYEGCTNHLGEYDEGIEGDEDRETVQQFDREIDALRDLIAAAKGEQA